MKKDPRVSKLPVWAQDHIRRLEQKLEDTEANLAGLTSAPLDCIKAELPPGIYLTDLAGNRMTYRPVPGRTAVVSSGDFQVEVQWSPEEKRSVGVYSPDPLDVRPEVSNSVRLVRRERR